MLYDVLVELLDVEGYSIKIFWKKKMDAILGFIYCTFLYFIFKSRLELVLKII